MPLTLVLFKICLHLSLGGFQVSVSGVVKIARQPLTNWPRTNSKIFNFSLCHCHIQRVSHSPNLNEVAGRPRRTVLEFAAQREVLVNEANHIQ